MLLEVKYLLLRMGPRNDQEVRIDGARLHHDLPAFEGIGNGHQETTGGGELRGAHHFAVNGIAGDGFDALLTQLRSGVWIALDYEVGQLGLAQGFAHYAANSPMADKDDVIGQPGDRYRLAATRFGRRPWLEG